MTLQVQVQGSGPALVLLHGWGMNAAVWRSLGAALAAEFCVHAVEMPCFGIAADASCDTLAATVAALAADLPPRATVCGWSLGGQVALAWARARPLQVERLILLATTPRFVAAADWADGMAQAEFEDFASDVAVNLSRARMRFLALQANGDAAARVVLRELREAMEIGGAAPTPALTAGLQLLRETDLRADLEQIGQPALIMHGVNDALIPCAAGACLARTLPDAEFVLVEGAAHAVFVTREAMLARHIREFHG